jgi:hypothetical protein
MRPSYEVARRIQSVGSVTFDKWSGHRSRPWSSTPQPHRSTHHRIETGRGTPTPGASSAPPGTSKGDKACRVLTFGLTQVLGIRVTTRT